MKINWRKATIEDSELYFNWANDKTVRLNSYIKDEINYRNHLTWFRNKLNSNDCYFYLFFDEKANPLGQVRIDKSNNEIVSGISIDENYRGQGLGSKMLMIACENYFKEYPGSEITAYIKKQNIASTKIFSKAGFIKTEELIVHGTDSFRFIKYQDERN
jgi:RimJ/RimL family protein N-acetyltransferase